MSKKALIIIDLINDFIHPDGALWVGVYGNRIVDYITKKLAEFRSEGQTIIFLNDSHDEYDREFELFPRHAVSGSWGAEFIEEITPLPGEFVMEKKRFSAFYGTRLEEVLREREVDEVEIAGVCTSICVMDTVGGLRNRDIPTTVLRDGVADFDSGAHEFALKRMESIYGAGIV